MARPQMDRAVGSGGPERRHTCRMEALRPEAWPNGGHRHRSAVVHTGLMPPPPPAPPRPGDALPPPPTCDPALNNPTRDSTGTDSERSGTREGRQAPMGLLPPRHSSSVGSPQSLSPSLGEVRPEEREAERAVAIQLRTIGDEINAAFLQRGNDALLWQGWRGLCRGLLAFISETLSTLYLPRLR